MKRALLSSREEEIATLVSEDLSDKEIALILRISPHTVRSHLFHITEKLDPHHDSQKSRRRVIRAWVAERDRMLATPDIARSA